MNIQDLFELLKTRKEYKEWKAKNSSAFLSAAFTLIEKGKENIWQLAFYEPDKDKITSFTIQKDKIEINQDEEVFKKPETKIKQLDIKKIKLNPKQAMLKADHFQKEKYPGDNPTRIILILQNLEKEGSVWNVTYISQRLNTLNIKLDAEKGRILTHDLIPLISFANK